MKELKRIEQDVGDLMLEHVFFAQQENIQCIIFDWLIGMWLKQ